MPKSLFTNDMDASLSVALWLAAKDGYDFKPNVNLADGQLPSLSCTDLLKSDRQLILRKRRLEEEAKAPPVDPEPVALSTLVASRMGHAIHDGIERSWKHDDTRIQALIELGVPKRVAKAIKFNPDPATVTEDDIPIYMEVRSEREIEGYVVSGKFDFVGEGALEDFKSTGVFTYKNKTNDDKYILQGSIYRWLNPDIVTSDVFTINYIFTDWARNMALSSKDGSYPRHRVMPQRFNLLSLAETEHYIRSKLRRVAALNETPEPDLPDCNSEELWQKEPVYKYYSNPDTAAKGGRATKNFGDDKFAAAAHLSEKGKGIVIEVPGQVVACKYCPEFANCTQKDRLIAEGKLIME